LGPETEKEEIGNNNLGEKAIIGPEINKENKLK